MTSKLSRLRLLIDGMLMQAQTERNKQVKERLLEHAERLEREYERLKGEQQAHEQTH